ncbi:MAG TPA: hypothetical protein VL986_11970 [Terracidiphilus sp.]|nr:hypothetical protein [Terracidiphilus sp.]
MKGVVENAGWLAGDDSLPSVGRIFFLISLTLVLGAVSLRAQCPDNGQTKVFNSKQGTGYYFYKFLGDSSFRYFLGGKTFSYNDKDDPGRTISFIDDMAYELIVEDRADFAKYIQGSKAIDILRAQAKYEQDHYKKLDPSLVITDFGPPSNADDGSNDRPFYLWKKESPPGKEAATQYLVSTLIKDRVVLLSIMLLKPSVTQDDVFRQLETYTGHFDLISGEQCASALSKQSNP